MTFESFLPISPRLAVARIKLHGVLLSVFSAHAPHEHSHPKSKSLFWEQLRGALVAATDRGDIVVLLGDFNARVGSVESPAIGAHDIDNENSNGFWLRTTLDSFSLKATSTFFPIGFTWTSTRGTHHRLDHICFSEVLHDMTVESHTLLGHLSTCQSWQRS